MITITITGAEKSKIGKFRKFMERELDNNPNLNGQTYKIEEGDFFCVDGLDTYTGGCLFAALSNIAMQS